NPGSSFRVRLTVEGGPSTVVGANREVKGTITVDQACTVQLLRVDPEGNVVPVGKPRQCEAHETYAFSYQTGKREGKELLKAVATQGAADLAGVPSEGNLLSFLRRQLGPNAAQWAEDQETLYVGDGWKIYQKQPGQ